MDDGLFAAQLLVEHQKAGRLSDRSASGVARLLKQSSVCFKHQTHSKARGQHYFKTWIWIFFRTWWIHLETRMTSHLRQDGVFVKVEFRFRQNNRRHVKQPASQMSQ